MCCWKDNQFEGASPSIYGLINYVKTEVDKVHTEIIKEGDKKTFERVLVYFHNLSCDAQFILKERLTIINIIKADSQYL